MIEVQFFTETVEDSYTEGELSKSVFSGGTYTQHFSSIAEAVAHIEATVGTTIDQLDLDDNTLLATTMETEGGYEPSEYDIVLWKAGKKKLFAVHWWINIYKVAKVEVDAQAVVRASKAQRTA